ncbi:MAG: S1 RNA-binding domain-containing protein [Actinobacteria bacterium]|nr:S1 RNA-binding domain-containing protein [Actinomycetota bacterium]MBV9253182.1 S1 RNA-binding domain-containing protein [Actinomycetota bacterium]MBV9662329.1 S1 RNA-binding domain-containing protein [Actinomycetota bacterium]MBV9934882.1 S1 RNA-binding domain-containing protein [Actinomycetota bacterium]
MSARRVVVDGSNLATEGRTLPSLAQLDEAVQEFAREYPDAEITVVVDGTFGYRIDESERKTFEEAEMAGEIVSPPAGAIGRGDAFVLRIAQKVGATVLSNDSFQEFHGEHEWLFDKDRLIGGKPVPGVGWIFTPRSPVRGPKSRMATQAAKRAKKADAAKVTKAAKRPKVVEKAIEVAVEEAVEPDSPSARRRRRRRGGGSPPAEPVNPPLPFITFVAEHPPGSEVKGEVESFSSHGAFVSVGALRCYLPLTGISDPPPPSARSVLKKGQQGTFRVHAFDPPRRGIELELVTAGDMAPAPTPAAEPVPSGREAPVVQPLVEPVAAAAEAAAAAPTPAKKRAGAKKAAAPKKVATKKAAAPKKVAEPKKVAAKKEPAPAKKESAPKKAAAPKAVAPKKAAPAKKAAVKKEAAPKKAAAKKESAPKKAAAKKAAPVKKATKKS